MNEQQAVTSKRQAEAVARATASGIAERKKKRHKLRRIAPDFDLSSIRCRLESTIQQQITGNADLMKRIETVTENADKYLAQDRLKLITEAYSVDEAITPQLHSLSQFVMRLLRQTCPLDVFVVPRLERNAFCMPSRKGNRLVMVLHAGLLAGMGRREVLFVMGHEIGHAVLRHATIPHVGFENANFSPMEIFQMRRLDRAQEISCDRFGLLACQDVRVASMALFKLASGLSDSWINFNEVAYARHFDRLSSMAELINMENVSRTHPLMPLRVKALINFARSDAYAAAFGRSGEISTPELENGVESMLSTLLPDFSHLENAKVEKSFGHFLIDGAMLMIAADGVIDPNEVEWLKQRSKVDWTRANIRQHLDEPHFQATLKDNIREHAAILRHKLSEAERAGLLHAMCELAFSAGGLPQSEFELLDEMRRLLGVRVGMAKSALDDAEKRVRSSAGRVQTGAEPPQGLLSPGDEENVIILTSGTDTDLMNLLEQIVRRTSLSAERRATVRSMFPGIVDQYKTAETAIRALIAWAITAGRRGGPLTRFEAVKLAISAALVFRILRLKDPKIRRYRGKPIDKKLRDDGFFVLFRKGEELFWLKDMLPVVVRSVMKSQRRIKISPPEDPNASEIVMPYHLLKDPVDGYWPEELTL